MGNAVSHRPESSTGKVILSDGTIHEFNTPLTAAELMLDHPRHMVVEISSHTLLPSGSGKEMALNSKRPIIPLPADEKLEKNKLYLMLPMRNRGKPASFSVQEIQRILLRSKGDVNSMEMLSSTTGFVPLLVRFVCTVGFGSEIDQSIVKMNGKGGSLVEKKELLMSDEEEDWPEYATAMGRQVSGRRWKPSLDTIVEKGVKQKEIQRILLRSKGDVNSMEMLSSMTGFIPLLVRFVCTVGFGSEIDQSIVKMNGKGGRLVEKKELLTSDEEGDWPEYATVMGQQVFGRRWKPSLDTIVEKGVKQKVRHWLV